MCHVLGSQPFLGQEKATLEDDRVSLQEIHQILSETQL
jgi:hypothetical protein